MPAPDEPSRTGFGRRRWALLVAAASVAVGCALGWWLLRAGGTAEPVASAVPVSIGRAETADVPVYLNGLGTVQPYETVTVSSRVDGTLTKVGFKQGEMVKQGQVLAEIDPRPYAAALGVAGAKKAQDQAALADAQRNLRRYSSLESKDFASRQQLDTQQAAVDQLVAQIAGDQASIDSAQTQLDYATIRSPIDGRAGFRLVDPGNIVRAAATTGIVTIATLQPISVVFTAPEQDIPQINKALAAGEVPVAALSSDGLRTLSQGKLAVVNNAVDQASGTIAMKATFANADEALWPGLSVATRLLVATLKGAIAIPDGAIQHGPDGAYVYVVGAGNKAEMRAVEIAQDSDGTAVVSKGLAPGEAVVTAGQYSLVSGATVQAAAPVAAAPGAVPAVAAAPGAAAPGAVPAAPAQAKAP